MDRAEPVASLQVEVVFSPQPRQVQVVRVALPPGSSLADALRASGLFDASDPMPDALACGIWGRRQPPTAALRDGDRVEVYRGLTVDPKEARRRRYKGQPKKKRPAQAGRS